MVERRECGDGRNVLVELLGVMDGAGELPRAPFGPDLQPRAEVVDGVHGARVVDLVGGDEGSVERARTRGVEELPDEALLVDIKHENAVDPEVLRAWVAVEVLPLRVFRIGRRTGRIRADVAEGA